MPDTALRYARRLLAMLGSDAVPLGAADHPALAWRRAGLMAVTGRPDAPGLVCPAALAAAADGALMALRGLAPDPAALPESGAVLLGERARLLGLGRHGRISANESCRLLDTSDGRIALNLAREDDWELLPILLCCETVNGWADVVSRTAQLPVAHLLERGLELGLPIARDAALEGDICLTGDFRPASHGERTAAPLVLDFSSLWAGPLAASLLGMMGAEVIKIESLRRPDGARRGHAGFHDLLNARKRSIAVDFDDAAQLARLIALVQRADIVIEGSRPRALRRLGIDQEAFVASGGIWVSITGYADTERVGFGDDAAVAAGLSSLMACSWGEAMFAGDAIADPLTGLHAALAAWAAWHHRRAALIHLPLAGVAALAMQAGTATGAELKSWQSLALADEAPLYSLRQSEGISRSLGADNAAILGIESPRPG